MASICRNQGDSSVTSIVQGVSYETVPSTNIATTPVVNEHSDVHRQLELATPVLDGAASVPPHPAKSSCFSRYETFFCCANYETR